MAATFDEALKRTHSCGQLRAADVGAHVRLAGWVRSYRDHGGIVFIDLRDRDGITQLVFDPTDDAARHALARQCRSEWVISVAGRVRPRGPDRINPKLPTGEIEVIADDLVVLNVAETVPFEPEATESVSEEARLKYRYIDLRRPAMARNLRLRAAVCRAMRQVLDERGFIEIETPFLTKSTPEGARDFLVPSRLQPGEFYALPQSPQLFKQILMVSGMDKYYQIVRCFRDEDLRADRQPEFTQLDVEMSFVTERDVMDATNAVFRAVCALSEVPFPAQPRVMAYAEAMRRFGTDRPDMRFGLEIVDVSAIVAKTDFGVFKTAVESGGTVRCIVVPGGADMTRKETDGLSEWAKSFGAKGLANTKLAAGGQAAGAAAGPFETGVGKFVNPVAGDLIAATSAKPGDALFFAADREKVVCRVLGELRSKLARQRKLIEAGRYEWVWITDFPLVEWNEEEKRWDSMHHPFTSPRPEDLDKLESDPGSVTARAYDIVLNGTELGGGSIRIHSTEVQSRVFRLLGISDESAQVKFGFLLDALRFGAPPHGGIALGLDRIVMLMVGAESIREVIAFPKTQRGQCPLSGAPSHADERQLRELYIRTTVPPPAPKQP